MALTEQQKEQRSKFVGSSDIGAIVGVDERRNAGDIFLQKTGQIEKRPSSTPINRGIELEPFVLNLFEAEIGVQLVRNVMVQGDDVCAANLDGAIMGASGLVEAPVEAKTTNMGRDWNQDTGQIPTLVLVQASFQIYCSGPQCQHAFVPALIPEFQRFKFLSPVPIVKRNDELIEELKYAAHEFMDYVKRGVRPPDATPHLESLKRLRREPESTISLGEEAAELWERYEVAGELAKAAERDKEEFKRQILDLLGTNEAGRLLDGRLITFFEQSGPRHCDLDQLAILSPELYDRTVSQSRFRVLRLKKAPKVKGARR